MYIYFLKQAINISVDGDFSWNTIIQYEVLPYHWGKKGIVQAEFQSFYVLSFQQKT